jgi:predicted  nucleic acid-binding Zn-ribbon protein
VFLNAQLSLLVQLQQFDLNINKLDDQRHKIPVCINEARSSLDQANSRLEDIKTALEKATADRRGGEQDLDEQESHVQKLRTRLMEIKTNKEYQAHLFEIDLANKKKDSLEERVLLAMERGEEKQKEFEEVQRFVDDTTQSFTQEKTQLESKAIDLDRELVELKVQKEDVLKLLDKPVYARYTKLKSANKVVVVAQVRSGTCQGCQLQIPPQLIADVKRADQLLTCPYCYRILYAEDLPGTVPEFSNA